MAADRVWVNVVGVAVGLLAWALAYAVLRSAPRARTNRLLAGVLGIEGALQLGSSLPIAPTWPGGDVFVWTSEITFALGLSTLPWLYLGFIACLDTPLVAPLASRRGRRVLATIGAALVLAMTSTVLVARPSQTSSPWVPVLFATLMLTMLAASIWGLAAAISAWRRAQPGTLARERAASIALAFGVRDGLVVLGVALALAAVAGAPGLPTDAINLAFTLAAGAMIALLAYGILRTQVLDIRARVRLTVRSGTVAAAFIVVYVIASQAATALIAPRYGLPAGLTAAAALILALMPLQRLAERITTAAMPGPDTPVPPERRWEMYHLAIAELGEHPDRAAVLAGLRRRLALATPARPGAGFAVGEEVHGRFRIVAAIGRGGEGRTYLAEDLTLQRRVVLKAIDAQGRPVEALLGEARALAALRHPRIAAVHDAQLTEGGALLVLEHVEGGSLQERIARAGPLTPEQVVLLAQDLLDALAAVHARGLVHRDVKPGNVLLTAEGGAKLADFGIAALVEQEATATDRSAPAEIAGSLRYLSPEQAQGLAATPRSDIYALGLTLYEALVGEPYLQHVPGETSGELLARAANPTPFEPPPAMAPPALARLLHVALEPSAALRPADAAKLRAELVEPDPPPGRGAAR